MERKSETQGLRENEIDMERKSETQGLRENEIDMRGSVRRRG